MYLIYVIKNEKDKIYIGQTEDLEKRLARHNGLLQTKSRSYTSVNKGLWKVEYSEECETKSEALLR